MTPIPEHQVKRLLAVAEQLAQFADLHTEKLAFAEYADLAELESRLRACADLLATSDPGRLLQAELGLAAGLLKHLAVRVGGA